MRTCALLAAAALVVAYTGAEARADVGSSAPVEPMETYYAGERRGGLWLMAMGVVGVGAGAYASTRESDGAAGLSYPLLGIGAVHLAAGVYLIVASNRRISRFRGAIARDAGAFVDSEHARIGAVQTQFLVLKIVEVALIAGGVGLAVYGEREDRAVLAGIGAGVAIEAAATLVFDIVAARRAGRYRAALGNLRVALAAPTGPALGLSFSTAF